MNNSKIKFNNGHLYQADLEKGGKLLFASAKNRAPFSMQVFFYGGSHVEKKGEYGVAHLVEHMVFRSTYNEQLKRIENLGGQVNAYTSKELIQFELVGLNSKFDSLIADFLSIIFDASWSSDDVEKEKKVILNEISEDEGDLEMCANEICHELSFESPLGHLIAGNKTDVNKLSYKSSLEYYKKYITPQNMCIGLSGDLQFTKVKRLINQQLKNTEKGKRISWDRKQEVIKFHNKTLKRSPTKDCYTILSFPGVSIGKQRSWTFYILETILADGMTSILFNRLRDKLGAIYSFDCGHISFIKTGVFQIGFQSEKDKIKPLVNEILSTLSDLESELNDDLVSVAKEKLIDDFTMSFDDIDYMAESIVSNYFYQRETLELKDLKNCLNKETTKRVRALLRDLIKSPMSTLKIFPK